MTVADAEAFDRFERIGQQVPLVEQQMTPGHRVANPGLHRERVY
jgi:hypothetical protein